MKSLLRNMLINTGAIWATSNIIPALVILGGIQGLIIGSLAFMVANILLVPLLRILLLPLNLLTLGIFAWLGNVLALYILVNVLPYFQITPFSFPGTSLNGFVIPAVEFTVFQVVILVSFMIGFIIHFIHWLIK